ncbi:MAG: tetratricopeptide repeat protein [Verrucomicrobiota bacterium]
MGINDPDNIRKPETPRLVSAHNVIGFLWKMLVVLLGMILCLRVPGPVILKLGLAALALLLGLLWIGRGFQRQRSGDATESATVRRGRQFENRKDYEKAIAQYEEAAKREPRVTSVLVRLLAAYDAAGEAGKARTLVSQLDGRLFQSSEVAELREIAGKYWMVDFEEARGGSVLRIKVMSDG